MNGTEDRPMDQPLAEAAQCVREIYRLVDRLEGLFPDRHFTPDGHMVGSIGEVLAAARFGLTLHKASSELHDATSRDGREVQIKATQGRQVAFRGDGPPDHLIVLSLSPEGIATTVYNGPGLPAWEAAGQPQSNGQRTVGLAQLRRRMANVPVNQQLEDLNVEIGQSEQGL